MARSCALIITLMIFWEHGQLTTNGGRSRALAVHVLLDVHHPPAALMIFCAAAMRALAVAVEIFLPDCAFTLFWNAFN